MAKPDWRRECTVEITMGVDDDLYDSTHTTLDVPYAALFTVQLKREEETTWSGVFSFDRLQPAPERWSPVQTASRMIAEHLQPFDSLPGCGFTPEIIEAMAQPHQPRAKELLLLLDAPGTGDLSKTIEAMEQLSKLEHPECLKSRLAEFRRVTFGDIVGLEPDDFRIYNTQCVRHERYDHRGCINRTFTRIVSREDKPHRLLFEYRPHHVGYRVIPPAMTARGISAHLRSRLRRDGVKQASQTAALLKWDARIRAEILGERDAAPTGITQWSAAAPEKEIHFILGTGHATGLAVPTISSKYGLLTGVRAANENVHLSCVDESRPRRDPVTVVISCKDSNVARNFVERLAEGTHDFVSLSQGVRQISAFYGMPLRTAIHAGFRPDDLAKLRAEFARKSGLDDFAEDVSRSLIFLG